MKKRLKGLLALTLALCMVLTMGVGLVSGEGEAQQPVSYDLRATDSEGAFIWPSEVKVGDILYTGSSGATMPVYYEGEPYVDAGITEEKRLWVSVDASEAGQDGVVEDKVNLGNFYRQFNTYNWYPEGVEHTVDSIDETGYVKDKWNASISTVEATLYYDWSYSSQITFNSISNPIHPVNLTKIPITYTINYDSNGGKGDIPATVWEYASAATKLSDGAAFTKEGYELVGWSIAPKGDTNGDGVIDETDIKNGGGIEIDKGAALYAENPAAGLSKVIAENASPDGKVDGNGSITLYAIWKGNTEGTTPGTQTEPPTTATADADGSGGTEKADKGDKAEKPENDGAADTGDSFSIMPWLILATVAAIGAVAVTSRKRTER